MIAVETPAPRWSCIRGSQRCSIRHLDRATAERHARKLGAGWAPAPTNAEADGITRLDTIAELEREARRKK